MTAPAHLAFGALNGMVLLSFTTSVGHHAVRADLATALNIAAVLVGSLAPDLDSSGSAISRAFPLSRVIQRRWAHRTLWHSVLGLGLAALFLFAALSGIKALLPIGIAPGTATGFYAAAYASHLVADCLTVRGVPLLYPYPHNFAFPSVEHYRLRTGNRKHELVFTGVSLAVGLLYLPVIRAGGAKAALHQALGSFPAAFSDYRALAGQEAILVFKGSYSLTREPVEGRGAVLEASPQRFVIYLNGQVLEVGDARGDVLATAARCIPTGRPVSITSIVITSDPWSAVVQRIPQGALVSGELSASHAFVLAGAEHSVPASITPSSQQLRFAYAQLHELSQLQPRPRTKEEELIAERAALTRSLSRLRQAMADTTEARNVEKGAYERERLFGALQDLRARRESAQRRFERMEQDLAAARAVHVRFSGVLSLRTPFVN